MCWFWNLDAQSVTYKKIQQFGETLYIYCEDKREKEREKERPTRGKAIEGHACFADAKEHIGNSKSKQIPV